MSFWEVTGRKKPQNNNNNKKASEHLSLFCYNSDPSILDHALCCLQMDSPSLTCGSTLTPLKCWSCSKSLQRRYLLTLKEILFWAVGHAHLMHMCIKILLVTGDTEINMRGFNLAAAFMCQWWRALTKSACQEGESFGPLGLAVETTENKRKDPLVKYLKIFKDQM